MKRRARIPFIVVSLLALVACACTLVGVLCGRALMHSDLLRQILSRITSSSVSTDFAFFISVIAGVGIAGGLMLLVYYFTPKKRVEK